LRSGGIDIDLINIDGVTRGKGITFEPDFHVCWECIFGFIDPGDRMVEGIVFEWFIGQSISLCTRFYIIIDNPPVLPVIEFYPEVRQIRHIMGLEPEIDFDFGISGRIDINRLCEVEGGI